MNTDNRVQELEELVREGLLLPMAIEEILSYEDRGFVVDLEDGSVCSNIAVAVNPEVQALAHLYGCAIDFKGGLEDTVNPLGIVETETTTHLGQTIILVRDNGKFWGWIVGSEMKPPMFRYKSICRDDAKRHIDGRQR